MVKFSFEAGIHAIADVAGSIKIIDVGSYLDLDLLSIKPRGHMNVTLSPLPNVDARWDSVAEAKIGFADGEVGGEIFLDLTYIALDRHCG